MLGVLVGLLCATTWATGTILLRDLARKLDPFTMNAPRTLVAGLAMFLVTLATGKDAGYQDVTAEKLFFLLGSVVAGGGFGDSLYVLSLTRIGVSRAFPIASTYPALTLLFGMLFLREQISISIVAGLVLVIAGILLISRPRPGMQAAAGTMGASGVVFALLASVGWAISGIMIAPGIRGLDPIMVASFRTPALSLVLFGVAAVRRTLPKLLQLSTRDWLVLVIGGLIGWGLGSVLFLWTVALVGATRAAVLTSTAPLFALPLSVIFLHERLTPLVLMGTMLTVLGIVLVS